MTSTAREESSGHPSHLDPSELGTKEYWESLYDHALEFLSSKPDGGDHDHDHEEEEDDDDDEDNDDDLGTSWFSEHKAPEKVLRLLTSPSFPLAPCNTDTSSSSPSSSSSSPPSILDLGTGNGSMLTLLRDKGGFTGPMVGVDYSPKSIELARALVQHRSEKKNDNKGGDIRFETWDILACSLPGEEDAEVEEGKEGGGSTKRRLWPEWFPAHKGGFDIVLDKGTFDAVSLSGEEDESQGRRICEWYPAAAIQLVRPGGFLVVTSCNWTEEELIKWFTTDSEGDGAHAHAALVVWDKIKYATFRFGGKEGQGLCTVCFQKKRAE